jgi:hypothetical protein
MKYSVTYALLIKASCIAALFIADSSNISFAATAGTIGSWNSTTKFPSQIENHAAVAFEGHIYVLGGWGWDGSGLPYDHNNVTFASVNSNGTILPWESTTPFATGRIQHAATIDPDTRTIYVIGGALSDGTKLNDVQYALILRRLVKIT